LIEVLVRHPEQAADDIRRQLERQLAGARDVVRQIKALQKMLRPVCRPLLDLRGRNGRQRRGDRAIERTMPGAVIHANEVSENFPGRGTIEDSRYGLVSRSDSKNFARQRCADGGCAGGYPEAE